MQTALITGASAGIGAASAKALAADGFHVILGARRVEKLQQLVSDITAAGGSAEAITLDVSNQGNLGDLERALQKLEALDVLLNNAGFAKGVDPVEISDLKTWAEMYDTNALGTVRITQSALPFLRAASAPRIINIVSIAGHEPYPGGGGYNASKHAQSAITRVLRLELLEEGIGVSEIDPGMVWTEFSDVRFNGDQERAAQVYAGLDPLTAEDVAESVRWICSLPAHVNIDRLQIMPRAQADAVRSVRR